MLKAILRRIRLLFVGAPIEAGTPYCNRFIASVHQSLDWQGSNARANEHKQEVWDDLRNAEIRRAESARRTTEQIEKLNVSVVGFVLVAFGGLGTLLASKLIFSTTFVLVAFAFFAIAAVLAVNTLRPRTFDSDKWHNDLVASGKPLHWKARDYLQERCESTYHEHHNVWAASVLRVALYCFLLGIVSFSLAFLSASNPNAGNSDLKSATTSKSCD